MLFTFTVTRSNSAQVSNPLTVNLLVSGTATFGTDYTVSGADSFTASNATLTIPANQLSAAIVASITPDQLFEPDESIILTIIPTANVSAVGSNPSATAIILDDDISSTIVLQINPTGSNNSTAFTDSSSFNRLITTSGDTKILNNEAIFDGSGDFLSIPSSVDFAAGSGDMTIELKLKTTQTLLNATCLSRVSSGFGNGSWTILNGSGNKPVIYWADFSTSSPFLQSSIAINDGITHHLAWVKSGNIHTLYIDGTIANTLTTGTVMQNSGANLIIGNDLIFNGRDYAGAISGVCISKLARSPGNFGLA